MADRELWSSRRDDGPILLTDNLTVGTPFGDYVPVTYVHSRRRGRLRYATLRARHRAARDQLVRRLRDEDPARWTYSALAGAVGCDQQLIRWILKGDRTRKR